MNNVEMAKASGSFIIKILEMQGLWGAIVFITFIMVLFSLTYMSIVVVKSLIYYKQNKYKKDLEEQKETNLKELIMTVTEDRKIFISVIEKLQINTIRDKFKVYYNEKHNAIIQTWIGDVAEDEFKIAILKTVELVKKHKAFYIISNTLRAVRMPDDSLLWLITDIDNQLEKLGIKILFFIVSDGATKKGVEYYQENSILKIEIFESLQEVISNIERVR